VSVTWVALLRGINVGRAKRITMADLRTMLDSLGYTDVRTLGQSGNAIFVSGERRPESLEEAISTRIRGAVGMEVSVLIRTAREFASVVDANPFVTRGIPSSELHVAFLSAEPPRARVAGIDRAASLPDEFALGKRVIYERLSNGVIGSTLPDWERVLGVRATRRNWNTTTKLRDLVS
jgi:uncharacterized protein (DUF1697 family)